MRRTGRLTLSEYVAQYGQVAAISLLDCDLAGLCAVAKAVLHGIVKKEGHKPYEERLEETQKSIDASKDIIDRGWELIWQNRTKSVHIVYNAGGPAAWILNEQDAEVK